METDPRLHLRLGTAVQRVTVAEKKRATGVEYLDPSTGETKRAEGDIVIICAGAIETPKILLASVSSFWPKGIGNDSGHVGKHFKSHQLLIAEGLLSTNPKRMQQELDYPTLCSRHFDNKDEQPFGKFFFVRSTEAPLLNLEQLMAAGLSPAEIDARTLGPMKFAFNGFVEPFAPPNNSIGLSAGTNQVGLPRTAITFSQDETELNAARKNLGRLEKLLTVMGATQTSITLASPRADHAASTCRMSASPSDGVVDKRLAVHEMDNLYICSNAVFPNIGAVNPTLTLTALAIRFVAVNFAHVSGLN
jgi:choline dehydrogenase-like flavoprotein